MDPIESKLVLLTCGDVGPPHGSRGLATVRAAARPGRAEIDPLLASSTLVRLVVAGTDADLAAALVRLLRRERLDVEVAFLPAGRSIAARTWGLPSDLTAAVDADARPAPLVRDDGGGVLTGQARVPGLDGEVYADDTLVLRGRGHLVVEPGPDGIGVRASRTGRRPDGRTRVVTGAGRGSATARAVQLGGHPFVPVLDGEPHPREVRRWAWYRHAQDWLLVRP